jgi:hypothetical protein
MSKTGFFKKKDFFIKTKKCLDQLLYWFILASMLCVV